MKSERPGRTAAVEPPPDKALLEVAAWPRLFLFMLAVAGGVVVGDLVWENPPAAQVTVFGQPITRYSQGWLLAMAALLGFVVALLLMASVGRPRGAGSVAGNSAGYGVIDANIQRSRRKYTSVLDQWFGP
jgi:hypothetical protein